MTTQAPHSILIALTNPLPGKEKEFNEWYDKYHVREIAALPGIISGRRYKMAKAQYKDDQPYQYVALYEIVPGTGRETIDNMLASIPQMTIHPVIDMEGAWGYLIESVGDTVYNPVLQKAK